MYLEEEQLKASYTGGDVFCNSLDGRRPAGCMLQLSSRMRTSTTHARYLKQVLKYVSCGAHAVQHLSARTIVSVTDGIKGRHGADWQVSVDDGSLLTYTALHRVRLIVKLSA
jgi:hypothetical protein